METRVLESNNGVLHVCCREGDFSAENDDVKLECWTALGFDKTKVFNDVMEKGIEARVSDINQKTRVLFAETRKNDSVVDGGTATEPLKTPASVVLTATSYEFEVGDMVWAKVKSYPWWPGQIFDAAFASHSVQRKRDDDHVLVAFYDNSYGWFDPAELIPFEPHYTEKSGQTNSRSFVDALAEATDEARRRSALGLACCCRNPVSFRPASVPGYFSVDVQGYEPGGVFSAKQIVKARESFRPAKMLSFVKDLALVPWDSDSRSIHWITDMATVLAFRTAVFEQFDEPYSHALSVHQVHSEHPYRSSLGSLDQPNKVPPRAPLSGPLVTAEALGERKDSTKPKHAKDPSKKDTFKPRDEPKEQRIVLKGSVAKLLAFKKAARDHTQVGDYAFEKRASPNFPVPAKQEQSEAASQEIKAAPQGRSGKGARSVDMKLTVAKLNSAKGQENNSHVDSPAVISTGFLTIQPPANGGVPGLRGSSEDGKLCPELLGKEMHVMKEITGRIRFDETGGPTRAHSYLSRKSESSVGNLREEGEPVISPNDTGSPRISTLSSSAGSKPKLIFSAEDGCEQDVATCIDGVGKKENVSRHQCGVSMSSEKSFMGEKKKKKKKKKKRDSALETNPDYAQKRPKIAKDGETVSESAGKSVLVGVDSSELPQLDSQKKSDCFGSTTNRSSNSAGPLPKFGINNVKIELPELVSDLLALAVDVSHGTEHSRQTIVRQIFLRFRSLVYQKSLVLPPVIKPATSDLHGGKSSASKSSKEYGMRNPEIPLANSKPLKHGLKPDDATKLDHKQNSSDGQEETPPKRLKKLSELRLTASEKKTAKTKSDHKQNSRNRQEIPRRRLKKVRELMLTTSEKKTGRVATLVNPVIPEYVKKPEPPVRLTQPTLLIMKFPPRRALPSPSQLKAIFARFGPLDLSGIRIYSKSSKCRVVFKHKSDAQTAYDHVVKNSTLFGDVRVRYVIRELDLPAPELPESTKQWVEERSDCVDFSSEPRMMVLQQQPLSAVQPKPCLKNLSVEDVGPVARDGPRGEFLFGGEVSYLHEGHGIMSHFQNANHHAHYIELDGRNSSKVDISHQMLRLLLRCRDIVHNVRCSVGYEPYYPL